ncbi:MAG: Sll0314/Alr1548 family TPR repeat-containing protein, partial [Waterburya sp.]
MNKQSQLISFINQLQRVFWTLPLSITMIIGISSSSVLAADPFRTENPRDIGKHTEQAFKTIFLEGNYKTVGEELKLAESEEADEPLAHAMLASLAYTEKDWDNIKKYADKTLDSAKKLSESDPVRGNLYLAVGHFLDGAYLYQKKGALDAIEKLQLVFKYLDRAEASDPNDPELNLIKG